MGKLSIIYRKIPELKPYPRNARTHSRKQVKPNLGRYHGVRVHQSGPD